MKGRSNSIGAARSKAKCGGKADDHEQLHHKQDLHPPWLVISLSLFARQLYIFISVKFCLFICICVLYLGTLF